MSKNPILHLEKIYDERLIPRWVRWMDSPGIVFVALAIFLLTVGKIFSAEYPRSIVYVGQYKPLLWFVQMVVMVRCASAGAHVMTRYPLDHDLYVLADINFAKWVGGKFWSVTQRLKGWFAALGIILLLYVLALPSIEVLEKYSYNLSVYAFYCPLTPDSEGVYNSCHSQSFLDGGSYSIKIPPDYTPAAMLVISLSAFQVFSSILVGMAVGSMIRSKAVSLVGAIVLRLIPTLIFSFYPDYAPYNFTYWRGLLARDWEYTWFALADGGLTAINRILWLDRPYAYSPRALIGVLAAVGFFALISFISIIIIRIFKSPSET